VKPLPIDLLPVAADLVAITAVAGIYYHRHQRRDLLLAYTALNVGIFSVTTMLTSATIGAGLGLGLFGILSIIRLRSDAITQEEIAYYFVALALGLLAGVDAGPAYLAPLLCALLVAVMYTVDHPRIFPKARRQLITLDAAIPGEELVRAHLEARLGVEVRHLIVQEVDFVRDLTVVDVRFRIREGVVPTAVSEMSTEDVAAGARPVPVGHHNGQNGLNGQNGHHVAVGTASFQAPARGPEGQPS
jgi:uncharacterized protein DUF4956